MHLHSLLHIYPVWSICPMFIKILVTFCLYCKSYLESKFPPPPYHWDCANNCKWLLSGLSDQDWTIFPFFEWDRLFLVPSSHSLQRQWRKLSELRMFLFFAWFLPYVNHRGLMASLAIRRSGEGRWPWATTISPSVPHISFLLFRQTWAMSILKYHKVG